MLRDKGVLCPNGGNLWTSIGKNRKTPKLIRKDPKKTRHYRTLILSQLGHDCEPKKQQDHNKKESKAVLVAMQELLQSAGYCSIKIIGLFLMCFSCNKIS